jgi:antitoxin (DNA-binding transcriptional repressor) of toxin-antitoxin stability system
MRQLNASKFKEQCLAVLDHLGPEGIIITKRGKPIAKLLPIARESAQLIGSMKGKVKPKDDLLSTGLRWDAEP